MLELTNASDEILLELKGANEATLTSFTVCCWFLSCYKLYPAQSIMQPLFSLSSERLSIVVFVLQSSVSLSVNDEFSAALHVVSSS